MSEKKISDNNQNLKEIEKRVSSLEKSVRMLEKNRGTSNISHFEMNNEEQWEHIQRNLHQTGVLLEYEIRNYLNNLDICHELNVPFIYPSESGIYFCDYYWDKMNSIIPSFNSVELETDIKAWEELEIENDDFHIKVKIIYFFECKSRTNPPINYLVIPDHPMDQKIDISITHHGSNFLGDISFNSNSIIRTKSKIIGIEHPKLGIDRKKVFNKAFWQLFRAIDYEFNKVDLSYPELFNCSFMKSLGLKYPKKNIVFISQFNKFYSDLCEKNQIPELLKNKVHLNLELYVPIIIVNGNIYTIDLSKGNVLFQNQQKIDIFVKNYNILMQANEALRYESLNFGFLVQLDNIIFPRFSWDHDELKPELDIIFISSNRFQTVFDNLRLNIKNNLKDALEKKIIEHFNTNKHILLKFQYFSFLLSKDDGLINDLNLKANERYDDALHIKRSVLKKHIEEKQYDELQE